MSTTKLIDNNRRTHAAKVLAQASKKHQEHHESSEGAEQDVNGKNQDINESISQTSAYKEDMSVKDNDRSNQIMEQYRIIRDDVLKLREDLSQGYDLLKEWVDTKISVRNILRLNR